MSGTWWLLTTAVAAAWIAASITVGLAIGRVIAARNRGW